MLAKYEEVQTRVERTHATLEKTAARVHKQNKLHECLASLKARADRIEAVKKALAEGNVAGNNSSSGSLATSPSNKGGRVDYEQTVLRLKEKLATKKKKEEEEKKEVEVCFCSMLLLEFIETTWLLIRPYPLYRI